MIDYALTDDGYFYLDENQELAIVSGHDEVIQAVRTLLRAFLEEWWLIPGFGMDYLGKFLIRDFNPLRGSSEVRKKTSAIEGVYRVFDVSCSVSDDQSTITVTLSILSVYSDIPETIMETITI